MTTSSQQARTITCPGCGGSFRVAPREGRRLPDSIPCPTCETKIPVDGRQGRAFWVSRSHADMFHRERARMAPEEEERRRREQSRQRQREAEARQVEGERGESGESRESEEGGEALAVHQPERRFESVGEARRRGGAVLDRLRDLARQRHGAGDEERPEDVDGERAAGESAAGDGRSVDAGADEDDELDAITDEAFQLLNETGLFDEESEESAQQAGSDVRRAVSPEDNDSDDATEREAEPESGETAGTGQPSASADEQTPASMLVTEDGAVDAGSGDDEQPSERPSALPGWSAARSSPDEEPDTSEESDTSASPPAPGGPAGPAEANGQGGDLGWMYSLLALVAMFVAVGAVVLNSSIFEATPAGDGDAAADAGPGADNDAAATTGAGLEQMNEGALGSAVVSAATGASAAAQDEKAAAEFSTALDRARAEVDSALAPLEQARRMADAEHWRAARLRALDVLAARGTGSGEEPSFTDAQRARSIYLEAVEADPSFDRRTITLGVDLPVGAVHALGGGWSISFRLTHNGHTVYAFKPSQKNWLEGWRAEIASYQLCRMIECPFDIPRNRPARISKARFDRLYRKVWDEDQEAYAERFDNLRWVSETGPDGEKRKYLYGTLKDWVPGFVRWPLEYRTVWSHWLNADSSPRVLAQPLEESLSEFKSLGDVDFYRRILEERGAATTRTLARQLSALLVFDYLVSNWDRFSTAEKYYGVNNQFADGRFISLDNGAAFPTIHFPIVRRRLEPVSRFSRRFVAAIRALEPEVVNSALFPRASFRERERLEIFWQQRDRFIDRLRTLKSVHGPAAIFPFR